MQQNSANKIIESLELTSPSSKFVSLRSKTVPRQRQTDLS